MSAKLVTRPAWMPTWVPRLSTLFMLGVAAWASPRLLPHLGALAGVRSRDASRPEYAVRTMGDTVLSSASLRGRVVLVNVWATWCLPCRAEMPLLEGTWRRHRDAGLVLIGASVDRGDPSRVQAYVTERGVTYPVAIVGQELLSALGGVRGYPTSVLIGRDGTVRHRVLGPIGPLSLEPAIRRALAEPAGAVQAVPDSLPRAP